MKQAEVYTAAGTKKGKITLPKVLFGQKPNLKLLAQAVRVHLARRRSGTASTKTRGEVEMTTAKWYRQKGTGRARHGARSAPIFRGGGVAHGPKPRDFDLKIPAKMKNRALASALSAKSQENAILVIDTTQNFEPKTKKIASLLKKLKIDGQKVLLVHAGEENLVRASRNLPNVQILRAQDLNPYEVLNAQKLLLTRSAVEKLAKK